MNINLLFMICLPLILHRYGVMARGHLKQAKSIMNGYLIYTRRAPYGTYPGIGVALKLREQ
jgi:hypothetical protein